MPNHIHGIIKIIQPSKISDKLEKQTYKCGFSHQSFNGKKNKFKYTIPGSISSIINQFKSSVTRWCNIHNFEFEWQGKFHDRIIRNKQEFIRIEKYIQNNISNWNDDCFC